MEKNVKIVLAISVAVIVIAGIALYGVQNSQKTSKGMNIPQKTATGTGIGTDIEKKISEASERINGRSSKVPSVDIPVILEGLIIVGILGVGWCGYRATKKVQEHP